MTKMLEISGSLRNQRVLRVLKWNTALPGTVVVPLRLLAVTGDGGPRTTDQAKAQV